MLETKLDRRHGTSNLSGDKGLSTQRSFMVEQDSVAGKQYVGFTIVNGNPIGGEFCDAVGRAGIKRRGLTLWRFHDLAVHFGGRCLIKLGVMQAQNAHRL